MFLRNDTVDKHGVSHPRVASSGASTGFRANALLGKPRAALLGRGRHARSAVTSRLRRSRTTRARWSRPRAPSTRRPPSCSSPSSAARRTRPSTPPAASPPRTMAAVCSLLTQAAEKEAAWQGCLVVPVISHANPPLNPNLRADSDARYVATSRGKVRLCHESARRRPVAHQIGLAWNGHTSRRSSSTSPRRVAQWQGGPERREQGHPGSATQPPTLINKDAENCRLVHEPYAPSPLNHPPTCIS